jgi:hypothetical protein
VRDGDAVSIDGSSGEVYAGAVRLIVPELDDRVQRLLLSCDAERQVPLLSVEGPRAWADAILDRDLEVVGAVSDLERVTGSRVVLEPAGDQAAAVIAQAIARLDGIELVFSVPDPWPPALGRLPDGNWVAVAATDRGRLAGRFLAATVTSGR